MVRMDRHIPYEKRMARVEDVIQEVSLILLYFYVVALIIIQLRFIFLPNSAVIEQMSKHYHRCDRQNKRFIRW
jgi:hypothetical protein